MGGPKTEAAIGRAADARLRAARLAAACPDPAADRWLTRHGEPAVEIYRELVRVGHRFGPVDLARATATYEAARRGLGRLDEG